MARSTVSGPWVSQNGFVAPVVTTANLPTPTTVDAGTIFIVSDNGAGDDEFCLVISTGTAWVTATGAALS